MTRLRLASVAAVLLAVGAVVYGLQPVRYGQFLSEDGPFTAVAHVARFRTWLPGVPGSGGDAPGTVTVSVGGRPCGAAPVPSVSLMDGLRWDSATVTLPAVAQWDLRRCTVDVYEQDGAAR